MNFRNHEVGILVLILTILQSWQYFPILVVVLGYQLIRRQGRIPKSPWFALQPLFLIIAAGLVFSSSNQVYEVVKDIWYILKILIIATIGIFIGFSAKPDRSWLRITAIYAGIGLFVEVIFFGMTTISGQYARLLPALGPLFVVIFFVRLADDGTSRSKILKLLLGALVLAVILISESRTTLLMTFIVWIGAAGIFQSKTKMALIGVFLVAAAIAIIPLLPQYDPYNITFLGKIQNSITELAFVTYDDMASITANWRGFEAYRAYEMWRTGSLGQKIFGHGLGAATDIGIYYDLFEGYSVRYLPILHNGYFMVLVKYGVLGVALFMAFMVSPFLLRKLPNDPHSVLARKIGATASVLLIVTTVSITGPFNISKLDGVTLMMGWAIGRQFQMRLLYRAQTRGQAVNRKDAPLQQPSHVRGA